MKKSKKLLIEMSGLPIVRKQLVPEDVDIDKIEQGDMLQFNNNTYLVTFVTRLGSLELAPVERLVRVRTDKIKNAKVKKQGMGSWIPVIGEK